MHTYFRQFYKHKKEKEVAFLRTQSSQVAEPWLGSRLVYARGYVANLTIYVEPLTDLLHVYRNIYVWSTHVAYMLHYHIRECMLFSSICEIIRDLNCILGIKSTLCHKGHLTIFFNSRKTLDHLFWPKWNKARNEKVETNSNFPTTWEICHFVHMDFLEQQ